jgi:hypothetical protein
LRVTSKGVGVESQVLELEIGPIWNL